MALRFAIRDLVIVAATIGLWWAFAARSAGDDFAADLAGFAVGLMVFASAYVAHEWSHYLGALASGGRADVNTNLASGFLFSFPAEGNSLSQFVVMSLSGFAATAAAIAIVYLALPEAWLATRVARGGVVFLAMLGVVLELPLLLYGLATRRVPGKAAVLPAEPARVDDRPEAERAA